MEAENEAVDVESVDDIRPASTLLECSSSDDKKKKKTQNKKPSGHHKEMKIPEDLDPESQELIKEMLGEERKYLLGRKCWAAAAPVPKTTDNKVSHHQRWTDRERQLFSAALEKYGHRWMKISEIIGTRTPQQVKTFSRYLSRKTRNKNKPDKESPPWRDSSSPQSDPLPDPSNRVLGSSGEEIKLKTGTESDEGEEIDILNDSEDEADLASNVIRSELQASLITTSQISSRLNLLDNTKHRISEGDIGGLDVDYTAPLDKIGGNIGRVTESPTGPTLDATGNVSRQQDSGEDPIENPPDENSMGAREAEETPIEGEPNTTVHPGSPGSQGSPVPLIGGSEKLPGSTRHDEDVLTVRHCGPESYRSSGTGGNDRLVMKKGVNEIRHVRGDASAEPAPFTRGVQQSEGRLRNQTSDALPHTQEKFDEYDREIADSLYPEPGQVASCSGLVATESLGHDGDQSSSGHEGLVMWSRARPVSPDDLRIELCALSVEERELNKGDLSTHDRAKKYMRIRNRFRNLWETRKPEYVFKSQIRSVFKKFGDTHTIARIHHNLEKLGLINIGVANPSKRKYTTKKQALTESKPEQMATDDDVNLRKSQRPRTNTYWRGFDEEEYTPQPKKKSKRVAKAEYDPFKLIECSQFTEENPAPFSVSIEADALALMDLHAHLSSAEVIGLLGGQYRAEHNQLFIRVATPCKSLSTGMQCEMDSVSQTVACDSIMSAGLRVVGWYHSHPAFLPNPSVRDIETQAEFQGWFSQDGAPFIGVIVSPYQRIEGDSSMINCLMVRPDTAADQGKYQPYGFRFTTCRDNVDLARFIQSAKKTSEIGQNYHLKIDMDAPYIRDQTYLEKTISSVCSHYVDEEDREIIRSRLAALLVKAERNPENDPGSPDNKNSADFDNG